MPAKLVIRLPYGTPVDWDSLNMRQQLEVAEHQRDTERWYERVQKKMTQGFSGNERGK